MISTLFKRNPEYPSMQTYTRLLSFVAVACFSLYGCSSSTGSNDTDTTPPPVPAGLTLSSFENGVADLLWQPVSANDLAGYYIFWQQAASLDSLDAEKRLVRGHETTISGLVCGVAYSFAVASIDEDGNISALSPSSTGQCDPGGGSLSAPAGFTIETIGNREATLSWNPSPGTKIVGYRLYWQADEPVDTASSYESTEDTHITLTGLDYNTTYYFAVSARDKSGSESPFSSQLYGMPLNTTPPSAPAGLSVQAVNDNSPRITVSWAPNAESDFSHYFVYRSTSEGIFDDPPVVTDRESYTDTSVNIGTLYYYRVTAVDEGELESLPSIVNGDTVLPAVTLVGPIDWQTVTGTPRFTWEPVEGALSYLLFVKTSRIGGDIWQTEVVGDVTSVDYTGTYTFLDDETYFWQVGTVTRTEVNSESTVGAFVYRTAAE